MNKYTLNEKGNLTYTLEGSSSDISCGLVNLLNDAVGKRGKNASFNTTKIDRGI